jgi:pimeloyl-ACP methyl ester carboxylesterase
MLPLILTHGWPGSPPEFLKVMGPLTDPVAHGGRAQDAFDVMIPAIPGYGLAYERLIAEQFAIGLGPAGTRVTERPSRPSMLDWSPNAAGPP